MAPTRGDGRFLAPSAGRLHACGRVGLATGSAADAPATATPGSRQYPARMAPGRRRPHRENEEEIGGSCRGAGSPRRRAADRGTWQDL
jgi:hypothetical protein